MSLTLQFALTFARIQEAQDVRVNYRTVAVPLSRALEELSQATKLKLKASGPLKNETVVISVNDVPFEEFKKNLAKAVVGEWTVATDGTLFLGPDATARAACSRQELSVRTKRLSESVQKRILSLDPKPVEGKEPPDMSMMMMGGGFDEASRLIIRLLPRLSVAELATIPKGGRVVYSTAPNSMQRPLSTAGLAPLVTQFVADHNKEVADMKNPVEGIDPDMLEKIKSAQAMFGATLAEKKKIETTPSKILVIAERESRFGGIDDSLNLELIAFDASGSVQATGTLGLDSFGMERFVATTKSAPDKVEAKPQHDPSLDKEIKFSPLSQELSSLSNMQGMTLASKEPSKELIEHLLRPDLYDPLSFEFSESLLALNETKGTNLVAAIPDSALGYGVMGPRSAKQTLFGFQEELESAGLNKELSEKWFVLSSKHPVSDTLSRVDRVALAKYLSAAVKSSAPSLDPLAEYATVNPPFMDTPAASRHLLILCPTALTIGMRGGQDWQMLRLYGLMSPGVREALRQGRKLTFSTLGMKGQPTLKQMVFGAGTRLQLGPKTKPEGLGLMGMAAMNFLPKDLKSFKEEPTELLPTGLPIQGTLALDLRPGNFVTAVSDSPMAKYFGAMGPDEYSMMKYFSEDEKMAAMGAMMPKLDKLKVGERDTLNFRLQLSEDVTQDHTLLDHRMAADAEIVGPAALPKDFMALVAERMKMFKEGLSPFLAAPGLGEVVPPR